MKHLRQLAGACCFFFAVGCAAYVAPIDENSLVTANNVRFSATSGVNNNCGTPAFGDSDTYALRNIIIKHDGVTRRDPVFDFGNQGFDANLSSSAVNVLDLFDREFRGACVAWVQAPQSEKDVFLSYHNEALADLIETATSLERQTTRDGFLGEVNRGRERWKQLVSRKPKDARWWSPT